MKVTPLESELMCRKSMILPSRVAEREDPVQMKIYLAHTKSLHVVQSELRFIYKRSGSIPERQAGPCLLRLHIIKTCTI